MTKIIKVGLSLISVIVLYFLFTSKIQAQVVINEVSPVSDPEWVEIYNTSSDSASLKNYSINFGSDSQNKFFCDTETLNANTYKVVSLSLHWLADNGDVVTLKNGDDIVDTIGYGTGHALKSPTSAGSISRSPDGSSNWVILSSSTKQGDGISFDCPSPTPTPTFQPTNTPTSTPTSTPIKTPTPLPTPTKTPTPAPTGTLDPMESLDNSSSSGEILGIEHTSPDPSQTPESTTSSMLKNKNTIIAVVLVGLGIATIGGAIYLAFKTSKTSKLINDI